MDISSVLNSLLVGLVVLNFGSVVELSSKSPLPSSSNSVLVVVMLSSELVLGTDEVAEADLSSMILVGSIDDAFSRACNSESEKDFEPEN